MTRILDLGQPVTISGQSGASYEGRIYDKASDDTFEGYAIACLTNSSFVDHRWMHHVNSVFRTDDAKSVLKEFKKRDDISHLILISQLPYQFEKSDPVDDLVRRYVHKGHAIP